jgi:pimeloyl-ACP methyl ester carboxylesterase
VIRGRAPVVPGCEVEAVIATPNPLRSVSTDAENVRRATEGIGGPILLVGHSYGGAVITEAAVDNDSVIGLAYVAAFAPDHGENSLQLTGQFPGSTLGDDPVLPPG